MGEIRCHRQPDGQVRAVAQFRDYDGRTRQIERVASSATSARNRLREAARDRGRTDAESEIGPTTVVSALAEVWYAELVTAVKAGDRSPGTARLYRDRLDNQVIPSIGSLRLREVTVSRVDRVLKATTERNGPAVAKATRAVLSGMFGLAVRHDAVPGNPVREVAAIRQRPRERRTLTLAEVRDLRAKLATDPRAVGQDLPDLVDILLATGLRIGEAVAVTWSAVDLDARTVEVTGTVVRVIGHGLTIKAKPKSRSGRRIVELPAWAVVVLRDRRDRLPTNEWDVVLPSPSGRLRDPSNTQHHLRQALTRAGYPDVTSHAFRRTVATLMDLAGLSARAAADQLGHAKVSMTTDVYFGRRVASTGAAAVLSAIGDDEAAERLTAKTMGKAWDATLHDPGSVR
jgi:integrase